MKYRLRGSIALAATTLVLATACGGGAVEGTGTIPPAAEPGGVVTEPVAPANPNLSTDPFTLNVIGPGAFATVTETGTLDLVSGERRPGYQEVIARWNELHPNVTLNITALPWDNWQASLQTAALAGDADVLVHAASIPDIVEPLNSFIAEDPAMINEISQFALRRVNDNFEELTPLGVSVTVNPVVVVIDRQLFEEWGVPIPDENWTLDDMRNIACTINGTNPVTGRQNYGISLLPNSQIQQNFIWASRAMDARSIEFGDSLANSDFNFDNQGVRDTLQFLTDLHACGSPNYIEGFDLENTVTADNDIAMYLNQTPAEEYNALAAVGLLDRFMFLPLPDITSGENAGMSSSHLGDWNMTVARQSQHQDWAWEFIRFMVTDPVVQDWLVRAGQIPNNLAGLQYVAQNMQPQYFNAIEHILVNQPENFSVQTSPWYDSTTIPGAAAIFQENMRELFAGRQTVDQTATAIQQRVAAAVGQ